MAINHSLKKTFIIQYLRTEHTSRNANILYRYPFHTIVMFYQEGVQSVRFRTVTLEIPHSLFTRNCYSIDLETDLALTPIHSPKERQGKIQNLPICSRYSADACKARRGAGHRLLHANYSSSPHDTYGE